MDLIEAARRDVFEQARRMWQAGLVVASAGNVSRRVDERLIAITPTSIPYERLQVEQVVLVELSTGEAVDSIERPSYELPMHLEIYRARADIAAIVHTHSPFVTTLSVLHRPLPPIIDEMLVHFGGTVKVAGYAFTGTTEVGTNVVEGLGDRPAVILANHGNVCVGRSLDSALNLAITMEATARVYVQALQLGEPVPLSDEALRLGKQLYLDRRSRAGN
jgi:L-fuculose-phosphate aldolase